MIHFFRRIRQALLQNNKFSKYAVYALGEIALVMIGILLALQVNNWNQRRQAIMLESSLLLTLRDDIEENLEFLDESISNNLKYLNSSEIILEALDNCIPYHDSLDIHFSRMARIESFHFSKASFETLKSEGVNIIRDKELRTVIINLFENSYSLLDDHDSLGTGNELFAPYIIKNFRWGFGLGVPNNYNSLCKDNEFKNLIYYMMNTRNNIDILSKRIKFDSEYVLNIIDKKSKSKL